VARSIRRNESSLPFPVGSSDPFDSNQAATLLAHVSDLVAIVDSQGDILHVSGSVERQLGHRAEKLLGGPISQLFVADLGQVSP
jgi:PAS domain S-box-containing protein